MFRAKCGIGLKFSKLMVFAAGLLLALPPSALQAQDETFLTPRRYAGMAFLASSLVFTYTGFTLRQDANDLYDRYKDATTPEEADRLYQRTSNRDIKSQVSWAFAAGLAISGIRLMMPHDDGSSTRDYALQSPSKPGLGWDASLGPGRVDFKLGRRFF